MHVVNTTASWLSWPPWHDMLVPNRPLLEIVVRGTLVYLALLALLRLVLRRQSAGVGVADLLVVVLIADAAQNALAGDYTAVPDGVLLVAVILFWAWFLDWLGFRVPVVRRLLHPPRLQLVAEGRVLWRNLARELVTMEELSAELRNQGIDDVAGVRAAFMEADGRITVIPYEASAGTGPSENSGHPGADKR